VINYSPNSEQSRVLPPKEMQDIIGMLNQMRNEIDLHVEPLLELRESIGFIERRLLGDRRRKQISRREQCLSFLEGKIITKTMLLASVFWQALNILLVDAFEDFSSTNFRYAAFSMLAFQLIHVAFIILLSIKLVHNVIHRSVNFFFIIQSYLSTIVMFAGVYLLIDLYERTAFIGLSQTHDSPQAEVFELYVDFLVFSIGVMSAGISKIVPNLWYAELVVGLQMLVCMVYWMFILGYGLDNVMNTSLTELDHEYVIDDSSRGDDEIILLDKHK
jgi:hypothetical protein